MKEKGKSVEFADTITFTVLTMTIYLSITIFNSFFFFSNSRRNGINKSSEMAVKNEVSTTRLIKREHVETGYVRQYDVVVI